LSEAWKEEVEVPSASPSAPLEVHAHPGKGSRKFELCLQRLLQAPQNGFCRISKQQWGLPTQKQKKKLKEANAQSQTAALLECLEKKANPGLPKGQSIWPHIEALGEQPLHPQLKSLFNKPALLSSLLGDLAHPENILPEHPSVATMASLQQEFARDFPMEYTRAFCSLVGPAGEFTMLGGDALRLSESAPFVYSASVSSALMEAVFYGFLLRRSALDSLLGKTFQSNANPAQLLPLAPWLLPPLIRQLFGIGYESETFWSPQDASCALLGLAQVPLMLPNRPVVFYLSSREKHLPKKQQAVVFEAMRKERVFFRNNMGKLFSLSLRSFSMQAASVFFPT